MVASCRVFASRCAGPDDGSPSVERTESDHQIPISVADPEPVLRRTENQVPTSAASRIDAAT
jgi:hypothetical protein